MTDKRKRRLIEIYRFLVVGGLGFLADFSILRMMVKYFGYSAIEGRLVSFPPAFFTTWLLHRLWTFESGKKQLPSRQFAKYLVIQVSSFLLNFLVYAYFLLTFPVEQYYFLVLVFASLIASLFTFVMSKTFAFS